MYLLTLNKVSDLSILKEIYLSIYNYGLINQFFIVCNPDLKSKTYKIPNLIYNAIKIDLEILKDYSTEDIEDIMFDLVEVSSNVIFNKKSAPKELIGNIEEICVSTGLSYRYYGDTGLDKKVDLNNLTFNDLNIIYDIFNKKNNVKQYNPRDFLVRLSIDNKGVMSLENGKKVGNILDSSFITELLKAPQYLLSNIEMMEKGCAQSSSPHIDYTLYEPWAFLEEDTEIFTKIEEYKWGIFEAIKNIEPHQYKYLSKELVEILNESEYIQFKDIFKIISKQDPILNYY